MTSQEIEERIDSSKQELSRLTLNHAISPLENPLRIKKARRDIARMMTVLRQKQINDK